MRILWKPPRKKLVFEFDGQQAAYRRVVNLAASMIRDRITKRQVDADGKPLPPLSLRPGRRKAAVRMEPGGTPAEQREYEAYQKLLKSTPKDQIVYRNNPRTPGEPAVAFVPAAGYAELKQRMGRKGVRDGTLSGEMWASLGTTLVARPDGKGGTKIVGSILFRGNAKSGSRALKVTKTDGGVKYEWVKREGKPLRNRDKAYAMQFSSRQKGTGKLTEGRYEGQGLPKNADFILMALSESEQDALGAELLRKVRLLK